MHVKVIKSNIKLLKYSLWTILYINVNRNTKMEKELNITVCLGSSCFARGNEERLNFIEKYVEENNLDAKIDITGSRCEGKCAEGPNITINGKLYSNITDEKLKEILDKVRG